MILVHLFFSWITMRNANEKKGKTIFIARLDSKARKMPPRSARRRQSAHWMLNVRIGNESRNDFSKNYITSESKWFRRKLMWIQRSFDFAISAEFLWFSDAECCVWEKIDQENIFTSQFFVLSINLQIISRGFMDNWIQTQFNEFVVLRVKLLPSFRFSGSVQIHKPLSTSTHFPHLDS